MAEYQAGKDSGAVNPEAVCTLSTLAREWGALRRVGILCAPAVCNLAAKLQSGQFRQEP